MNVFLIDVAEFIGSNPCGRIFILTERSDIIVVEIDNLNAYYGKSA